MANYQSQARRFARRYGLDPNVFVRQIRQESGFQPHVVSPAGARGIAQFMPGTAAGLGVNPDHPTQALKAAAKLMADYVHKYGSYKDALVAYNAGPGRVGHSLPGETQRYIATILGGSNPSTSGVHTGSAGGSSGGSTTRTTQTTSITPDAQQAQRSALAQFVMSNHPDPVSLAQNYAALGQQTQTTTKVRTTPDPTSSGGSPAAPKAAGVVKFDGKPVAAWIAPALAYARQHGWKGTVNSGFRSLADQTRIYNSGVRPAAKPGTSNHEGSQFPRGAVDVSDAQTLSRILRGSRYGHLLVWAGAKDPPHFSHPHNGSY